MSRTSLPIYRWAVLALLVLPWVASPGLAQEPEGASPERRGLFVTLNESGLTRFVKWKDETTFDGCLAHLRAAGGGVIRFSSGEFELERSLSIVRTDHVRISGSPGSVLHFAPEPEVRPAIAKAVQQGDTTLTVDDASTMRANRAYQAYAGDLSGDRILEFAVKKIEGNVLHLNRPVRFLSHVKEVPAGSTIVDEISIFKVLESADVTIENLVLDGRGRGDVLGHTTYCGVWAIGVHKSRTLPTTFGLTVRGCTIKDFDGRGVCAYSLGDVVVEGCRIEGVRAQAIEIDHFACGRIEGNHLYRSDIGIALNDAFDTVVRCNTIEDCRMGVAFVKHFDDAAFNTGLVVSDNCLIGKINWGIDVRPGITGNTICRNHFDGFPEEKWITGEAENDIRDNGALK